MLTGADQYHQPKGILFMVAVLPQFIVKRARSLDLETSCVQLLVMGP